MYSTAKPVPSARRLAYQALYEVLEKEAYANIVLQNLLGQYALKTEESHLLTELVYGVLRKYNYLLWIISRLSSLPVRKLHPSVRIILCLGLYQLIFLSRIPESAAVNESVKIAKKVTHAGNVRFVNALLRNYLRKKDSLQIPSAEENALLHDELTYCQPGWLITRWQKEWGFEKAHQVLEAFNKVSPMTIRVNKLKQTREELLALFEEEGIEASAVPFLSEGICIQKGSSSFFAKFLKDGRAYVQSLSSMIPAGILDPKPGEKVLDMCAAPGSKTTQMAEMMGNNGSIDAWDLYPHKISLIKKNAKKEGITIIHAGARDSAKPMPQVNGKYDRVLLDAPCSGLGVLGHKAEIRWRRNEKALEEFPPLQKQLLRCAAAYVKKGGILVYSTCTLNAGENEEVVKDFLTNHTDFEAVDFALEGVASSKNGMMTIWPDEVSSDGFFVAKFRRKEDA